MMPSAWMNAKQSQSPSQYSLPLFTVCLYARRKDPDLLLVCSRVFENIMGHKPAVTLLTRRCKFDVEAGLPKLFCRLTEQDELPFDQALDLVSVSNVC